MRTSIFIGLALSFGTPALAAPKPHKQSAEAAYVFPPDTPEIAMKVRMQNLQMTICNETGNNCELANRLLAEVIRDRKLLQMGIK